MRAQYMHGAQHPLESSALSVSFCLFFRGCSLFLAVCCRYSPALSGSTRILLLGPFIWATAFI